MSAKWNIVRQQLPWVHGNHRVSPDIPRPFQGLPGIFSLAYV